jgi:hypothetical protein
MFSYPPWQRDIFIYERESEKERFFTNRGGVQLYSISLSLSLALRGVIFFQVIRAARADRILRLLGALTKSTWSVCAFSQRTFLGEKKMVGGDHLTRAEFFFLLSSPRNKKDPCTSITVPDFLNRKWEYTHTHGLVSASAPSKPLTNSSSSMYIPCVVKVVFYYKTFFRAL